MRLTKGTRVEILSRKEVVTGAWLCGEILSRNGHMYSVRCGWPAINKEVVVERVPKKAIRPCPPPVEGAEKWAPGDLAEVFHKFSWKIARIVADVGGNVFFVRLLGSPQIFRVHCSYLRVRQSWEHGKWFVVGKQGSKNYATSMGKREPITRIKVRIGDDLLFDKEDKETQKHHVIFSRNLKRRSPFGFSCIEEQEVATKKIRPDEKDGSGRQISSRHSSPTSEKVDAISSHASWGENGMHSSLHIPTDTDSCASSVGSCSVLLGNCNLSSCFETRSKALEDYCSDAESFS